MYALSRSYIGLICFFQVGCQSRPRNQPQAALANYTTLARSMQPVLTVETLQAPWSTVDMEMWMWVFWSQLLGDFNDVFTRKHPETLLFGIMIRRSLFWGGLKPPQPAKICFIWLCLKFLGKDFPSQGGFVGEHECFIVHISWMKFQNYQLQTRVRAVEIAGCELLVRLTTVNVPNLRYLVSAPSSFIHRLLWKSEDLKFRS